MKRTASVRELHINTSRIPREVQAVIEERGVLIAELRPLSLLPISKRLPDREKLLLSMPVAGTDSGRILEEDGAALVSHWAYMVQVKPGDPQWDRLPGAGVSVEYLVGDIEPPVPASQATGEA